MVHNISVLQSLLGVVFKVNVKTSQCFFRGTCIRSLLDINNLINMLKKKGVLIFVLVYVHKGIRMGFLLSLPITVHKKVMLPAVCTMALFSPIHTCCLLPYISLYCCEGYPLLLENLIHVAQIQLSLD